MRKISLASAQAWKKYMEDEDLSSHRQLLQSMVFIMARLSSAETLFADKRTFRLFLYQDLELNEKSIAIVESWLEDFWQSSGGFAGAVDFYRRSNRREGQHDRFLFHFLERFSSFGDEKVDLAKLEFCRAFSIQCKLFQDELLLLQSFPFTLNDTELELRRKYKELVREYHPDKGGSSEQFAKLKACFDFLTLRQSVLN